MPTIGDLTTCPVIFSSAGTAADSCYGRRGGNRCGRIGDGSGSGGITANANGFFAFFDFQFGNVGFLDNLDEFFYFSNIHSLLSLG